MNLFSLAILLVFLPIGIQILIGSLILAKKIKLHFGVVTLLSTLTLFLCIYLGDILVNDDAVREGVRCGMPGVAFFFFGFMMLILQLIVVVIQLLVRKKKSK